MVKHQRVTSTM